METVELDTFKSTCTEVVLIIGLVWLCLATKRRDPDGRFLIYSGFAGAETVRCWLLCLGGAQVQFADKVVTKLVSHPLFVDSQPYMARKLLRSARNFH